MILLIIIAVYSLGLFVINVYREYKKYKDSKYKFLATTEDGEFIVLVLWPVSIIIIMFYSLLEPPFLFLTKIPKYVAYFLIKKLR